MNHLFFLAPLAAIALSVSQLEATIFLDDVMTKEDQKKTGVSTLSYQQRMSLEKWLNEHVTMKSEITPQETTTRSLSININNGQKILLSDNTLWEVSPDDISTSSIWITPFPVQVSPSGNPDYPSLLINVNTGARVKARQISNQPPPAEPAQPAPTPQVQPLPPSSSS